MRTKQSGLPKPDEVLTPVIPPLITGVLFCLHPGIAAILFNHLPQGDWYSLSGVHLVPYSTPPVNPLWPFVGLSRRQPTGQLRSRSLYALCFESGKQLGTGTGCIADYLLQGASRLALGELIGLGQ